MNRKIYEEELLDHYKYPQNTRPIDNPDFSVELTNPACGDKIYIEGCVENNKLTGVCFKGSGCVISQATASMLTEVCKNKTLDGIEQLSHKDITALIGVELGPVRLKCALLCLQALQKGIAQYKEKNKK